MKNRKLVEELKTAKGYRKSDLFRHLKKELRRGKLTNREFNKINKMVKESKQVNCIKETKGEKQ